MRMHAQMVYKNSYSPPEDEIWKGELIISTLLACPQHIWEMSQVDEAEKETVNSAVW